MDAAFMLNEEPRTNFLRLLMQSFGCTYICLWSYFPHPSNFLWFLDGYYQEEDNQPTSSSGSLARRLFDLYPQSVVNLDNNDSRVPGFAFRTRVHYMELRELELRTSASMDIQRQFYQEARIKKAIFMGCSSGEIELGFANDTQTNMEMEMRNWFPEDFSRPVPTAGELPQPTDLNRHSSSSSSLRSVSIDSPESSSLVFNIPTTTHIQQTLQDVPSLQPIITTTTSQHQQVMQAFARIRNIQLPNQESEDAAMTRAILAVLTYPPPSSSSPSHQPQQNFPDNYPVNPRDSAFKHYVSALAPTPTTQMRAGLRRHSLFKRSISYYRSLNVLRRQHMLSNRPTSTQLHHMISERKRREKLNESFQSLRSLLPPGTKKDKASVLTSTKEYLSSLKSQIAQLSQRNHLLLEAKLFPAKEAIEEAGGSSNERLNVRVTHVSESNSEERIIDLQVTVRGECPIVDMVIRILEFLKQDKKVHLMSMEANTRMAESTSSNRVILRLKVEGSEWDESAFQEAVRRVVADMAQ